MFTINRIALQYKQEYIKRMSSEFKRGMQTGEFIKDTLQIVSPLDRPVNSPLL